jgi:hypothetical protein
MAFLAQHLDAGASSSQITKLIGRVCQEIELALVPIVGQRGLAALFARSLHLSVKTHPWLSGGESGLPLAFNSAALCAVIAQQARPEAMAGACFFLQTFCELLVKLVGRELTERLLRTPWLTFLSGSAAQDDTQ